MRSPGLLRLAVKNGDVALIRHLIACGHDVNGRPYCRQHNEETLLHLAAQNGKVDAVVALIDAGAEIDPRDLDDWTPLFHAANKLHTRVMSVLIAAGANVHAQSRTSKTVWTAAHFSGDYYGGIRREPNMDEVRRTLRALLRFGVPFDDSLKHRLRGPALAFVKSIKAAGGWDDFVLKHRAVLKSIVSKCAPVPDDCLLAIAAFVAPPGGW